MTESTGRGNHTRPSTPNWLKAVYVSWAAIIVLALIGTLAGKC